MSTQLNLGDNFQYTVLDKINVWVQVIDPDGHVLYLNQYAREMSGAAADDYAGEAMIWEQLLGSKEAGLKIKNVCCGFLNQGKNIHRKKLKIVTAKGGTKLFEWTMTCDYDDDGDVSGATIIGVDLMEMTGSIDPVVAQDEKYHAIFRNAPIGFFRSLPEGRFLEVNDAFAALLGYDNPEEVLANVTDIANDIYQTPESRIKIVDETLKSGKVLTFETVFKNRKGKPVDVRINVSSRLDTDMGSDVLEGTIENISDKKAAERKLNRNLKKYTTLFQESPISLWEMDYSVVKSELDKIVSTNHDLESYLTDNPDALKHIRNLVRIIDVNTATLRLLDANSKETLLTGYSGISPVALGSSDIQSLKAIAENRVSFEYETTYNSLESGTKNVIVRWVASPEEENPYSRLLVSMIDITAQIKEQEALRRNKNRLSSLFRSMDDAVFIIDKNGKYEFVAPTNTTMLLATAEEIQGRRISDFFGEDLAKMVMEKIGYCLKEKKTVKIEYPFRLKNKQYWAEARISPLTKNSVIVVARDVTERLVNENVSNVMLNVAKAVSLTDDLDELFELIRNEISRIIDTKNFFLALFDPVHNSLSLPYFRDEKDNFDHFPAEKTMSALVIKEKRSLLIKTDEIMKLAEEGKVELIGSVPRVWLGIPLMVEGEVLGLMVVQSYNDENAIGDEHRQLLEMISPQISLSIKRKQSEQLLKRSEKELRESNLTKDRFFNIIAHDLKNPFNAIIGFASLLTEEWNEFDDGDKISMISSIKSSSEGAYELLMNLLEWSRLHVGKIALEPEFIDFSSLVRLNFSLLRAIAENKNIKLNSVGICDRMVWADPNMIKTVIRNLLTNAIKFTPENGNVMVECRKDANHPGMVVLSITDNGVGIPQDEIDGLFDLTRSGSTVGTEGETGTGLGLVLCKEFVEKNHGKIWVESEMGKGSTFFVALPVRPQ